MFLLLGLGPYCSLLSQEGILGVKAVSKTVLFNHLADEVDGEPTAETCHVKSGILKANQ